MAPRNYGSLRKHQLRAVVVAREIVARRRHQKVTTAGVTPGGGKTLMCSLFANELADGGLIQQVLVVVPNDPLRVQMERGFHDKERGLTRYLKQATSQGTLPGLGKPFGKVITYQSLMNARFVKRLVSWMKKSPTLVIFDECHHLCTNKAWENGATPLVEAAAHVLCQSGTLWRWDEERIPFISYDADNRARVDIRYSRPEALAEQAILPVEFKLFDGKAIYQHREVPHESMLSSAPLKEQARALATALNSDNYAEAFLVHALSDWEKYNSSHPSRAIIVCKNKKLARQALAVARQRFEKHNPVLSVSGETGSNRAILAFIKGINQILVTVKKAYEGLDVREATHLIYLSDVRSTPFLDQVIARITRFNPNSALLWNDQRGYVYAPDDHHMRHYVNTTHDEQAEYFKEHERNDGGVEVGSRRNTFKPIDANVTNINHGIDGRCLTVEENIGVNELGSKYPTLANQSLTVRLQLANDLGLIPLAPGEEHVAAE